MICSDDGYDGDLQVKSADSSHHKGFVAAAFRSPSQRKLKTGIKDLQFSALDVVIQAEIKEYFYKSEMEELYKRRADRKEGEELPTTNDIKIHYGIIADDAPVQLTGSDRTDVDLYSMVSINMAALKEYVIKTDARLDKIEKQLEKVINSENNS